MTIDFASRLNYQFKPYVAWLPDPGAKFIDAFTLNWADTVFYAFPPFSIVTQVLSKIKFDGAKSIHFPQTSTNTANDTQLASGSGHVAIQARPTSSGQQTETDGLLLIRGALTERGLSCQAIDLILASWRLSTQKQYLTYIHKWVKFCNRANLDIFTIEITYILEFLTGLFNDGLGYSAINTARSVLSTFLGITVADYIGTNAPVMRFMKGVSRNRPSAPRYNCIWDVDIVLNMFRKQPLAEYLSLYDLTLRTVTLLALVSVQRGQSIHLLDTDDMTRTRDKFVFHLHDAFKHARPGFEHLDIVLAAYVHDIRICIVHTLSLYLERTRSLRTTSTLFISTVKPHGSVSKDTIARWIKATLKMAGVDVEVFKPHSTRAAATSAAVRKGVLVSDNLKVAGWSKETTFARFYIYNSVLTCRQHIINSSASAPPNAMKIAVKKGSDVVVCMFGPEI